MMEVVLTRTLVHQSQTGRVQDDKAASPNATPVRSVHITTSFVIGCDRLLTLVQGKRGGGRACVSVSHWTSTCVGVGVGAGGCGCGWVYT